MKLTRIFFPSCLSWLAVSGSICSLGCESKPKPEQSVSPAVAEATPATAAPTSKINVHDFKVNLIDGTQKNLADYKGKALLIVNVASECGYTPQYEPLQELYDRYQERGLVVLGFPANNFGQQEPGSNEEILAFGQERYGVTFPLFEKVAVKGSGQAPLYQALTREGGPVSWNFNKFLIAPDGSLVEHFESSVKPMSPELIRALESVLPKAS
jgi:glutathione peroxidase